MQHNFNMFTVKDYAIVSNLASKHPGKLGFTVQSAPQQKQEKELPMTRDERTEAQQARDYLIKSLDREITRKDSQLEKDFYINAPFPENLGELRKWVKEGKLGIRKEWDDTPDEYEIDRYDHFVHYITYRDDKRKADNKGYAAARKLMLEAASATKDQIVVFDGAKGLEALNAFKAQTFH